MKLTEVTLKNRTVIVVLAVILVFAGLYSYITIPKESNPAVEIPIFIVTTIYPGISPSDMESLITQPIERELQGITGVTKISSVTNESVSSVVVEFDLDVPMVEASQRVRERVDIAKADLPPDAEEPFIIEIDIDDLIPIMTVNLAADYPLSRLTEVAERLQDELETVSGVREAEMIGEVEREVQVNVDLAALNGYGLSFGQLVQAIQGQNLTIPGGTMDVDMMSYLLRVSGEFQHPYEINDLVVARPMGEGPLGPGLVYMRDVADVKFGFKDRESFARLRAYKIDDNGKKVDLPDEEIQDNQVISLNLKKRPGLNIIETVEEVFQVIDEFPLPSGTSVIITGDQSEDIKQLISDLENSIISGMLFVILVLVFFLGIRNALLVGTAVPLSIMIGFIVLLALGYTANFVILFSLIIALGLLVDNSIVVVENIYRYREMGYERFDAAKRGADEVGYALIAATSTLLAAFIPMLFWPGVIGQFMGFLPLTLIIVLLCSLFVALVLYPVLTGYLVRLDTDEKRTYPGIVKGIIAGIILLLAVMIAASNWISLVVLILTVIFFVVTYKFIVKPLSIRFNEETLPAVLEIYKSFLNWILVRDYSTPRSLLKNTFSLGAILIGILLAILGLLFSTFSPLGIQLSFVGGGIVVIGIIGALIHSVEAIYRGGKVSVIGGIILAVLIAVILLLVSIGQTVEPFVWLVLMMLPLILIVIGSLGFLVNNEKPLILTDNRALLLNSVMGIFVTIFALNVVINTGQEFFPSTDPSSIIINLEGPIGMNVYASEEITRDVQERLYKLIEEDPKVRANIENIQANVGVSGDVFFGGSPQPSPELSRVRINLVDYGDRAESSSKTMTKIREIVRDIPDVIVKIDGEQQGPPTGPPVNIEVSGEDFDEIVRISRDITEILNDAAMAGDIPGLVDVRNNVSGGLPEYRVLIDYERASRFGLSVQDIAQTIRIANNGLEASKWRDGEDEYDIMVRLRPEDRQDLESLRNLNVSAPGGPAIPLVSVADFVEGSGLGTITRLNLRRTATVVGEAAPGFSGPEVLAAAQKELQEYRDNLPLGYNMEYTGESEDQEEAFGFLTTALMVGFALIFLVMLTKFNNVVSPLIIIVAVGLSLIGVLLGLVLTRTPFGLMTFIGIISLAGIVCVNNIVLLDYVKQLSEAGKAKKDAIIEAGMIRFRPVLLTALTTILGLVPLTFGINIDFVNLFTDFDPRFQFGSDSTAFWGPMGIAIISGLTFATFLTLVVVPVLYSAFDSVAQRSAALMKR